MSQYINKIRTNAGDLQIDYNALANLPTISNPNLLINSDFRNPVNQRGQTSYIGDAANAVYTIDRWRTKYVQVTVNSGNITLSNTTESTWGFGQYFESPLPTNTYTVSLKVLSVTGLVNVRCTRSDGAYEPQLSIESAGISSLLVEGDISDVVFVLTAGSQIQVEWIKLEQGENATQFVPRNYGEELALCQRYYEKRDIIFFPYAGASPSTNYVAVNGGSHMVTKRAIPIVAYGTFLNRTNGTVSIDVVKTTQSVNDLRMIQTSASCDQYFLGANVEFDAEVY